MSNRGREKVGEMDNEGKKVGRKVEEEGEREWEKMLVLRQERWRQEVGKQSARGR